MKKILLSFVFVVIIGLVSIYFLNQISLAQTTLTSPDSSLMDKTTSSVTNTITPTDTNTIISPITNTSDKSLEPNISPDTGTDISRTTDTTVNTVITPIDNTLINNIETTYPKDTDDNVDLLNQPTTAISNEIIIEPKDPTVNFGDQILFKAFYAGKSINNITWIIAEEGGGTINNDGIYIAPQMAGVFHLMAKSPDNDLLFGMVTINVRLKLIPTATTTAVATTTIIATTTSTTTPTIDTVGKAVSTSTTVVPPVNINNIDINKNIFQPVKVVETVNPVNIRVQTETIIATNIQEIKKITDTLLLIQNATNTIKSEEIIQTQGGDLLYKDSNNDGISDYDSIYVYNLDPVKPTATAVFEGKIITAGEKVLLGFDPKETKLVEIKPEEPVSSLVSETKAYKVDEVSLTPEKDLLIIGRALPNSYITLYIYSTPIIVTVKTNTQGEWKYTLNRELDNGKHEIYTATVNNTGKILAKSPAYSFVKTAEAAALEILPPVQMTAENLKPGILSTVNSYVISGCLLLLFLLILIMVGKNNNKEIPPQL